MKLEVFEKRILLDVNGWSDDPEEEPALQHVEIASNLAESSKLESDTALQDSSNEDEISNEASNNVLPILFIAGLFWLSGKFTGQLVSQQIFHAYFVEADENIDESITGRYSPIKTLLRASAGSTCFSFAFLMMYYPPWSSDSSVHVKLAAWFTAITAFGIGFYAPTVYSLVQSYRSGILTHGAFLITDESDASSLTAPNSVLEDPDLEQAIAASLEPSVPAAS